MTLAQFLADLAAAPHFVMVSFATNDRGDRLVGLHERIAEGDEGIRRGDYLTDGVNIVSLEPVVEGCLERGRDALAKALVDNRLNLDKLEGNPAKLEEMRRATFGNG